MRTTTPKVPWRKLICNNPAPPKCVFICWLALHGRLSTCENLAKIGISCDPICNFCKKENESITSAICRAILSWLGIFRAPGDWQHEIQVILLNFNKNAGAHQIYRMIFSIAVYMVWKERNARRFQNSQQDNSSLLKQIQVIAYLRCLQRAKLAILVP